MEAASDNCRPVANEADNIKLIATDNTLGLGSTDNDLDTTM